VEAFAQLLTQRFSQAGAISAPQVEQLYRHYQLLVRWNRVLNLTSIVNIEEMVVRHYCESLFLGLHLPLEPVSVLDVGSGAGFPGIPMAILRPDCRFTLAESHQRKAVFLREASGALPNVRVVARRAAEIEETFEWVVSRAVGWKEVLRIAGRLGHQVALLLGERDARDLLEARGVLWQQPVPIPWGKQQVLVLGQVGST
jgi:16S rRNA (guanine527-N7)-methyltransferase